MNELDHLIAEMDREYPSAKKDIVTFPSGAYNFYFFVANEQFVLEYLPLQSGFGVSKVKNATFGFEGVENSFQDFETARQFVFSLLKHSPKA